ncbi:MAG: LURP-one-related/scramblase family protein, partial [Nodosilinea sp.]
DRVFKVNGKALRVRETLVFEDLRGNELCKLQERMVQIKDSMAIESPQGVKLAMVKKALVSPLRDRWVVKIGDGPDLEVQGNILDHEYSIEAGRDKLAEVSKRWFRLRDTYGVEIEPGQNDVLMLAVTVAIDMMAHEITP